VAGNSPFRGIVFCNLGTSKTVITIRHHGKYCYPTYFPIWLPQQCSRGTKKRLADKKVEVTNVLIPSTYACYLTIASSGFFGGGRLRVPTRRCDLVVPADGGWGHSNKLIPTTYYYSKNLTNVTLYTTPNNTQHTTSYTHKKNFVHNTTNNTSSTRHHDPPRPSASSGFKIIGECDRPTSHGDAQSPQHGDAIF
jgi:hypothetical protein